MTITMLMRGTMHGCVLKAAAPAPVGLPRGVRLPGGGVAVIVLRDVLADEAVCFVRETAAQHAIELA